MASLSTQGALGQTTEPNYPGSPPSNKLEVPIGQRTLRLYGILLLNMAASDSVEAGQDTPLWPLPNSTLITFFDNTREQAGRLHDISFTARQSVFGAQLRLPS